MTENNDEPGAEDAYTGRRKHSDMDKLDDEIAGEAAIGLHEPRRRERLEERAKRDKRFARKMAFWRQLFSAFDEDYESVRPPAYIKVAIDSEIAADRRAWSLRGLAERVLGPANEPPAAVSGRRGAFIGALAGAFATFMLMTTLYAGRSTDLEGLVLAALKTQEGDAQVLMVYDSDRGSVHFVALRGAGYDDREYRLWLLDDETRPMTLLGRAGPLSEPRMLEPGLQELLVNGAMVGMTVEPAGGAPEGGSLVAVAALSGVE